MLPSRSILPSRPIIDRTWPLNYGDRGTDLWYGLVVLYLNKTWGTNAMQSIEAGDWRSSTEGVDRRRGGPGGVKMYHLLSQNDEKE